MPDNAANGSKPINAGIGEMYLTCLKVEAIDFDYCRPATTSGEYGEEWSLCKETLKIRDPKLSAIDVQRLRSRTGQGQTETVDR